MPKLLWRHDVRLLADHSKAASWEGDGLMSAETGNIGQGRSDEPHEAKSTLRLSLAPDRVCVSDRALIDRIAVPKRFSRCCANGQMSIAHVQPRDPSRRSAQHTHVQGTKNRPNSRHC